MIGPKISNAEVVANESGLVAWSLLVDGRAWVYACAISEQSEAERKA